MRQAVLFDLDETLLDRTMSLAAFLADQHARFGAALGHAPFPLWRGHFLRLDQRGHVNKAIVYPEMLKAFGGDPSKVEILLADYQENCCRHARAFDGMAALLLVLRQRGMKLGIVTNGETAFQTRHVEALGLADMVDAILISQTEGLRKPDAALFRRAAQKLGVAPQSCLFVGDNPQADILRAHSAGIQTAWFAGGQAWPEDLPPNPGATILHLSDVASL